MMKNNFSKNQITITASALLIACIMILASCGSSESSESSKTSDYKDVTLDMGDEYSIEEIYSYEYKATDREYDSVVVTIADNYLWMASPEEAQKSEIDVRDKVYDSGEFEVDGLDGLYVEASSSQDYRTWDGYLPWKDRVLYLSFGTSDSEEGVEKLNQCKKIVFNNIKLNNVDKKGISIIPDIYLQSDDLRKTSISYTDMSGKREIASVSIQYSTQYEGRNSYGSAKEAWDEIVKYSESVKDKGDISVNGKQSYWIKNESGYLLLIPDKKHSYVTVHAIEQIDVPENSGIKIEDIVEKIK